MQKVLSNTSLVYLTNQRLLLSATIPNLQTVNCTPIHFTSPLPFQTLLFQMYSYTYTCMKWVLYGVTMTLKSTWISTQILFSPHGTVLLLYVPSASYTLLFFIGHYVVLEFSISMIDWLWFPQPHFGKVLKNPFENYYY